jgi:hypothetical protein
VTLEVQKRKENKMPWTVGRKTKKGFPIKNLDTGKIVAYSKTKAKAEASVRARYANYK